MLLDYYRDGVNGADLGDFEGSQFALTFYRDGSPAEIMRRRASERGKYGGWRWECNAHHPAQFPGVPMMAWLATRLDAQAVRS